MYVQLLHLNGPLRGQTIIYKQRRLVLGTAPESGVTYLEGTGVEPQHAVIHFEERGCAFHLKSVDGPVFVNHREIHEVILEDRDLIEIGKNGPKVRFRIHMDETSTCKPVHQMISDARDVRNASGIFRATQSLGVDLFKRSSWRVRVGVPILLAVLAFAASYLGGRLGGHKTAEDGDRKMEIERARYAEERRNFETKLGELKDELIKIRTKQSELVSQEDIDRVRHELARHSQIVNEVIAKDAALRQVLDEFSKSVCLIHGIYEFRYEKDGKRVSLKHPDATPLQVEYFGSGFLASSEGHIVTNRHVAEPWWNNDEIKPFLMQGFDPEFVRLDACFPGREPIAVDPVTIRYSKGEVDVAIMTTDQVGDLPVLPLFDSEVGKLRGHRIILLGYPTGLHAVLARCEPSVVEEIIDASTDTHSLIVELSKRNAISPVITQGNLNEVKPFKLVYDAETTSGGSGGPVFGSGGKVIGVNFAITPDFDGSNFGVPIQFALELLKK